MDKLKQAINNYEIFLKSMVQYQWRLWWFEDFLKTWKVLEIDGKSQRDNESSDYSWRENYLINVRAGKDSSNWCLSLLLGGDMG
jgi:L-rhamnose mutarotase